MNHSSSVKPFSEIFRNLLDRRGLKLNEVSKSIRIPEATLFRYMKGSSADPSQSILVPLSRYFQVSVDYLLGIEETPSQPHIATEQFVCDSNSLRKIPLIGWENVKDWGYWGPSALPEDHPDWVYFEGQTDLKTFALPIESHAYKYVFPKYSVIIVEPQSEYKPDDYVVACINRNKSSIKQVTEDNGKLYLNSLSTSLDSEPLESPNYVYGKIIRSILDFAKIKTHKIPKFHQSEPNLS